MTFVHLCRTLCQFFHSQNENLWKQHTEQQQSAWVNGAIAFSLFLEFVIFSFGRIFRVLFCLRCNLVSFSRGISLGIFGVEPATNVCTHRFYQITNGSWRGGESEKMSRKNNRTKGKKKTVELTVQWWHAFFDNLLVIWNETTENLRSMKKNVWCRSLEKRRHRAQFSASQKNKKNSKCQFILNILSTEHTRHIIEMFLFHILFASRPKSIEKTSQSARQRKKEKKKPLYVINVSQSFWNIKSFYLRIRFVVQLLVLIAIIEHNFYIKRKRL